ncbi:hypothetical protein D3C71_1820420 [compost metagenome]
MHIRENHQGRRLSVDSATVSQAPVFAPSLAHSAGEGWGGGAFACASLLLLLFRILIFRFPSVATELADKTPNGATHKDVRRFSTRQGCLVEKSCQWSGPAMERVQIFV